MKCIRVLGGVMAFLVAVSGAGVAAVDTVTLHGGTIIEGTIVDKNDRYLAITTPETKGGKIYCLSETVEKVNGKKFQQYRLPKNNLLTQKFYPQKGKKYPVVTIKLKDGRTFIGELVQRQPQYFRIIPTGKDNYQEFLITDIASIQ
jgi:hypothetical protein